MACRSDFNLIALAVCLQLVCGVSSAPTDGHESEVLYGEVAHDDNINDEAQRSSENTLENMIDKRNNGGHNACPQDFRYVPTVNGCYKVMTDYKRDWKSAADECGRRNSHLLVINDAAEQHDVVSMIRNHYSESSLQSCIYYQWAGPTFWTAGHRVVPSSDSPFVWKIYLEDGKAIKTSHMGYTNWCEGQPSFHAGDRFTEACLAMHNTVDYQWNDISCSLLAACTICEVDL